MCEGPCYVIVSDNVENHIAASLCMFSSVYLLQRYYVCSHKVAYEFVAVCKGSEYRTTRLVLTRLV
jgi:hypothetical protein